jgi:hypothetical protein
MIAEDESLEVLPRTLLQLDEGLDTVVVLRGEALLHSL